MFVHRWTEMETSFIKENKDNFSKEKLLTLFCEKFGVQLTKRQLINKIASMQSVQHQIKVTSICWNCARACGGAGCPWVDHVIPKPVDGWKTIKKPLKQPVTKKRIEQNREIKENLVVIECPLFVRDYEIKKTSTSKLNPKLA